MNTKINIQLFSTLVHYIDEDDIKKSLDNILNMFVVRKKNILDPFKDDETITINFNSKETGIVETVNKNIEFILNILIFILVLIIFILIIIYIINIKDNKIIGLYF